MAKKSLIKKQGKKKGIPWGQSTVGMSLRPGKGQGFRSDYSNFMRGGKLTPQKSVGRSILGALI